ncbi:MAG: sugar nucleotide-binding protein [Clostridia bacterium]
MEYVENTKPEYIINCAAYTAVDKAEENYDLADRINGDGPTNLAKAAKKSWCKISTYIYRLCIWRRLRYIKRLQRKR